MLLPRIHHLTSSLWQLTWGFAVKDCHSIIVTLMFLERAVLLQVDRLRDLATCAQTDDTLCTADPKQHDCSKSFLTKPLCVRRACQVWMCHVRWSGDVFPVEGSSIVAGSRRTVICMALPSTAAVVISQGRPAPVGAYALLRWQIVWCWCAIGSLGVNVPQSEPAATSSASKP